MSRSINLPREQSGGARAYGVPFQEVWRTALDLVPRAGGWRVVEADPRSGVIELERTSSILGRPGRLRVDLSLDTIGMTRVELRSVTRRGAVGRPGRQGRRLLRLLDRVLRSPSFH